MSGTRLSVRGLHVELGGAHVVRGVDLVVEPGTVLGLVGPNGSGKSSLLRCLYRLHRPTRGQVLLDGVDVWSSPRRATARQVAVMVQEAGSDFDVDVRGAVLLGRVPHQSGLGGRSDRDEELVLSALHEVGASHLVGRGYSSLSGGEKQRVLLARCLVQEPSVLVLDEPTNHLDIAFQHDLLALVRAQGLTTVVALHDLNLALAYCDEVAVLRAGRLVASGPPGQVLTAPVVEDVFGVGVHTTRHPGTGRPLLAFSRRAPTTATGVAAAGETAAGETAAGRTR